MKFSARGIALPFVLLVITLMLVGVSLVTKQGLGSLHQAKTEQFSKQALFAAEAGAADALRRLVEDPAWTGPLGETTMEIGSVYSATILNNIPPGAGTQTASNGAVVPERHAYILAVGRQGTIRRQVGLLLSPGSSTAYGVAIGVSGDIDMGGSKRVAGTVKASGDISVSGSTRIEPMQGSGRLLSGGNISASGSTRVDESQDVRAIGSVPSNIRGGVLVQGNDTSDATLPFIADGRTTNELLAGERGLVLPNPVVGPLTDPLVNPDVIIYDPINPLPTNLEGKIYYFPGGVTFGGSTTITGPGSIVTTGGNPIIFQGSSRIDNANLIALGSDGSPDPAIDFQGSTRVSGLIYAHKSIEIQGSFRLDGVLIAYLENEGHLTTQGSTRVTLDSSIFADIPGFESWAGGFGGIGGLPSGAGPLSIVSWERM